LISARLKVLLRCLISIALVVFVLRKVDWHDLGTILFQLDLRWALAGWALTFGMIVLLALRWRLFLVQQQLGIPFRTVLGLTWAGQFFNSVLPGSTGGDVIKIYQLCRIAPQRKAAAAASVFADRLGALVALVFLAGIGFVLEPAPLRILLGERLGIFSTVIWSLGLSGFGLVGGWLLWRRLRLTPWAAKLQRLFDAVRACFSPNYRLAVAFSFSFLLHFLNFFVLFLFARSLGISITYGQVLLMMPVILFLVMIPVTINGHGLRELLLMAYFASMGIVIGGHPEMKVQDTAVALSLLAVTNDLLWSLPGGLWYLLAFRTSGPPAGQAAS
jgi:glycosyltransferase 2 family protein